MIVLKKGFLSTWQDLGRKGYRSKGINTNGVMDTFAMRTANLLLQNPKNTAVLEMHYPAPELLFTQNSLLSLTGADFKPKLNEKPIANHRPIFVEAGSILKFQRKNWGERCYLAISGGFDIPVWLNSSSTNLKIDMEALKEGVEIQQFKQNVEFQKTIWGVSPSALPYQQTKIRVLAGAEWDFLSDESQKQFQNQAFKISLLADRMGYRLEAPPLQLQKEKQLVSSPVSFGTIQLLPNGQTIILMADHQTTGGYPRIGQIISTDLPLLAQKSPNQIIEFELIDIAKAEKLYLERKQLLKQINVGILTH